MTVDSGRVLVICYAMKISSSKSITEEKHEWKFGRTKMMFRVNRRVFPQLFEFEFSQASTSDRNTENILAILIVKM